MSIRVKANPGSFCYLIKEKEKLDRWSTDRMGGSDILKFARESSTGDLANRNFRRCIINHRRRLQDAVAHRSANRALAVLSRVFIRFVPRSGKDGGNHHHRSDQNG